jgi:hypothetical protein
MQYVLHSFSLAFLHPGIGEVLVPNMNTFADFSFMGVADFFPASFSHKHQMLCRSGSWMIQNFGIPFHDHLSGYVCLWM